MIDDINHDDGMQKVVQIVVSKSIKYTMKRLELLYLRCSGCNKSVPRHFPFLNSLSTSCTSATSGTLLFIWRSSGGNTWGYFSGLRTSGWIGWFKKKEHTFDLNRP